MPVPSGWIADKLEGLEYIGVQQYSGHHLCHFWKCTHCGSLYPNITSMGLGAHAAPRLGSRSAKPKTPASSFACTMR